VISVFTSFVLAVEWSTLSPLWKRELLVTDVLGLFVPDMPPEQKQTLCELCENNWRMLSAVDDSDFVEHKLDTKYNIFNRPFIRDDKLLRFAGFPEDMCQDYKHKLNAVNDFFNHGRYYCAVVSDNVCGCL
jgi:hypothetical protein